MRYVPVRMVTLVLFGSAMASLLARSAPPSPTIIVVHARPAETGRYNPAPETRARENLSPQRRRSLGRYRSRTNRLLPELLRVVRPEHAPVFRLSGTGLGFAREEIRHHGAADRRGQGALPRALQVPRRDRDRVPCRQVERQDLRGQPCRRKPRHTRGRRPRDPRLGAPSPRKAGPPEGDVDTGRDQGGVRVAMAKTIITSPGAPTTGFTDKGTPSPLAQAIRAGNLLFVSGQGPLDQKTREVVSADIREQTRQTLTNLKNVLAAAGLGFTHVVNMRVVLRNVEDFPAFNEAFREFLQGEKVTRTCVGATPHRKGVNVEIDCVASFE